MKQIARVGMLLMGLLLGSAAQAGKVTYVYTDIQGTPVMESDAQGNITARFDYTPYGVPVQSLGGSPSGPGYTGHVNDPDTGFVYMQARYYDPVIGRFLSVDPRNPSAGNIFGLNRMLYGNANPIANLDPSGMSCEKNQDSPSKSPVGHSNQCMYEVLTFKQKLQRNMRWMRKSVKAQLGIRLGLNAKVKVGKMGKIELGTGYIGEGGELNANFDYAQIYSGKGPSAAFQIGRLKLGAEAGGWETRTPISVTNGISTQESRTDGFLFGSIVKNNEWVSSPNTLSIEANPLILHGEVGVNVTGVVVSIFYWGDSEIDPTE